MTESEKSEPLVTLAICTKDRPEVVAAVTSALASEHEWFEVLLIDQSRKRAWDRLPAEATADPRFRCLHIGPRGAGSARNVALQEARGQLVAFTDDDCTVPASWLGAVDAAAKAYPDVGMIFTNVRPGPHDLRAGFIPGYERRGDLLVRSLWGKWRARGIGAGMAVRRSAAFEIGGFDERLGPGADFPACEEGDLAARLLLSRWAVLELGSTEVMHHGFRTWGEGRALARRNWLAVGAAYSKLLKTAHPAILSVLGYELGLTISRAAARLRQGKRPQGLLDALFILRGIGLGLCTPLRGDSLTFAPPTPRRGEGAKQRGRSSAVDSLKPMARSWRSLRAWLISRLDRSE